MPAPDALANGLHDAPALHNDICRLLCNAGIRCAALCVWLQPTVSMHRHCKTGVPDWF